MIWCRFFVNLGWIMIGETKIEIQLNKAMALNDAKAWFDSHTPFVKEKITKLIRFNQLEKKGVNKYNEIIGTYSPVTQSIDPTKIAGSHYTLFDTGLFYRSMLVKVLKDSILIDANAHEMEDQKWWSTNILGLNEENLDWYKTKIRANFIRLARKQLGIN